MNTFPKLVGILSMSLMLFGFSNCSSTGIKYESDRGMLAPYQAEALEFPVMVNGATCKDMSGKVGACTKIVSEREDINYEVVPLAYNYNIKIRCSSAVNFNYEADVLENETHKAVLSKVLYQNIPEFICSGRITPSDRNFVSSRFELRVRVQDGQYITRGEGHIIESKGKTYLNMGKNALYTYVYDGNKWVTYVKKPLIEIKKNKSAMKAFSESSIMRLNYYNH